MLNVLTAPRLASLTQWLLLLVVWMLAHVYIGLIHDSIQYSMQGLAHLRPDLYSNDLYLRYGSQDNYSLFAPLYARLIGLLGLEHAASLLTLVSQAAYFSASWLLVRRLEDRRLALLSLLLLLMLPGGYGALGVFHVTEDFATPRLLAEALVLLSLSAALGERLKLSILLCALAGLLHPLMAMPNVLMLIWMRVVTRHPRSSIWVGIGGLAAIVALGQSAAASGMRFDGEWLDLISSKVTYLFLRSWPIADWIGVMIPAAALMIGWLTGRNSKARDLMLATLCVGTAGLALSAIGGDWLHLKIIVQGQPWRWMWVATVVSTALLPRIATDLWTLGAAGRIALALLASSYLVRGEPAALPLSLGAVVLAWVARWIPWKPPARSGRLLDLGLLALIVLCAVISFANLRLSMRTMEQIATTPGLINDLRVAAHSELAAFALLGLLWVLTDRLPRVLLAGVAVALFAFGIALSPRVGSAWTGRSYTPEIVAAFAPWRDRIPAHTEVLYTDDPLDVWVLLERPDYFSGDQAVSAVFSRDAAIAVRLRARELTGFLGASDGPTSTDSDSRATSLSLIRLCRTSRVRYVMTRDDLQAPSLAAPSTLPPRFKGLRLYSCDNTA